MAIELYQFDQQYVRPDLGLVGVDEAGRGCLAGPVSAACVWLRPDFFKKISKAVLKEVAINDSKQLKAEERLAFYEKFKEWSAEGYISFQSNMGSVEEIEEHNILGATRLAMRRSLDALADLMPEDQRIEKGESMPLWDAIEEKKAPRVLVDGRPLKPFVYRHEAIVKGDAKSLAIAMASIVAKVERDALMLQFAEKYPGYGLESHKGYATIQHRKAILEKGPLAIHRKLFLRKILE